MKPSRLFDKLALICGFAFLYLPIFILIIYSFNASRLVTVWGGFSTHWYGALLENGQLLDSVWVSLRVAFVAATLSTGMGLLLAQVLARYRFRGKAVFSSLAMVPLVLPEVILGLSLLLLFVALDLQRGYWTIVLAHASFAATFATVIIHAQLIGFDRNLEDAAFDLGCSPWKTFLIVTLPLIAPSVVAAWLLSFTLSMDDLVIASFTTGPGATTLPIRIYSAVRLGISPEINALSTILIVTVSAIALTVTLFGKLRLLHQTKADVVRNRG